MASHHYKPRMPPMPFRKMSRFCNLQQGSGNRQPIIYLVSGLLKAHLRRTPTTSFSTRPKKETGEKHRTSQFTAIFTVKNWLLESVSCSERNKNFSQSRNWTWQQHLRQKQYSFTHITMSEGCHLQTLSYHLQLCPLSRGPLP